MDWPATIVYVEAVKDIDVGGVTILKGSMALSTPGRIPASWAQVRQLTDAEHQAMVSEPYDVHHYQPLCFF